MRRSIVLLLASLLTILLLPASPASADTVPDAVAQLGGPLHAEFYSSGLEVAADGTIVIADTGNNQVAKYDQDGNELWRIGRSGPDVNEFLRPRDVSVVEQRHDLRRRHRERADRPPRPGRHAGSAC